MYNNIILNLFNNPKNAGRISKPDGIADCYNFDETSHVEFSLRIENDIITESKFRAQANPYIVAVCSTITQMIKGKAISMLFLDPFEIKNELRDDGLTDISFCIECVKMAIEDYKEKTGKSKKQKKKDKSQEEQIVDVEDDFLVVEEAEIIQEPKIETIIKEDISPAKTTAETIDDDDFADFFDDLFDEDI